MRKLIIFLALGILLISGIVYAGQTYSKEVKLEKDKKAVVDSLGLTYSALTCSGTGDDEHCTRCMHRKGSHQDEGCTTIMKKYCKTSKECKGGEEDCGYCLEYSTYTDAEIISRMDTELSKNVESIASKEIAKATKVSDKIKLEDGGAITTSSK